MIIKYDKNESVDINYLNFKKALIHFHNHKNTKKGLWQTENERRKSNLF